MTSRPAAEFLDRACFVFGSAMEADIDKAVNAPNRKTESSKNLARMVKLNSWLGLNAYRKP